MKASIFLIFSVLIHCYIFRPTLSVKRQSSLFNNLLLRKVKAVEVRDKELFSSQLKKVEPITEINTFSEPKLFAPKKLSLSKISELDYRDGLIYLVQSKTVYPPMSKDFERATTVTVAVDLNQNGKVLDSKIHNSSGFRFLDEAALQSVRNITAYKPLPKALHPYATFLVPIHFF